MTNTSWLNSTQAGFGKRFRDMELWGDKDGQIVTNYQEISEHVADRIFENTGDNTILEICCGIGSATIMLAKKFSKVIALDINPERIEATKLNLKKYSLLKKVELITGDALDQKILNNIKNNNIEAVTTDVTWSETGIYGQDHTSDLAKTTPPTDQLFESLNKRGWTNICMRLPKTIDYNQLSKLGPVEIEEISINGSLKFIYAYYGKLINLEVVTRKNFEINRP